MDHSHTAPAMTADSLHLDETAVGLLAVIRHLLTSLTRPESQAWQAAFVTASERWGETTGPQRVMAALAMVQAMRKARPTPFAFANPLCLTCRARVTTDEAALIGMVQAMRRGHTAQARDLVEGVTGGRMDPALIRAGLSLAGRLGTVAGMRPTPAIHAGAQRGLALVH